MKKPITNLLRMFAPASLVSLTGCIVLALLFGISIADILTQVGCEQCFGGGPDMIVTNGVEGREIERPSPESPPIESTDQEPEDPGLLATIGLDCDALFELLDFLLGGSSGPSQNIAQIRSGGFAIAGSADPASRYQANGDPAATAPTIYLTNSVNDTVMAIDAGSRTVTGTVRVGERPRGIAITPGGESLFIANEDSGNVSVIETGGLSETTRIPLPGAAEPYHVAITPDGAEVWVTSHEASGFVHIIDAATLAVTNSLRVGRSPVQVAISPDGTLAYVTNEEDNRLSILDVWTHTVQRSLTVPSPYAVAFDPTGARVYVSSHSSPGTVRMIDVASDAVLGAWDVGTKPEYLALDPLATRLFVTNRLSPFISVINLLTGEVEREIPAPRGLGPLAALP